MRGEAGRQEEEPTHKKQAAKPRAATATGPPTRSERAAAWAAVRAVELEAEAAEEAPKKKKEKRKRADLDSEKCMAPGRSVRQGYLDQEPKKKKKEKKKKAKEVKVRAAE